MLLSSTSHLGKGGSHQLHHQIDQPFESMSSWNREYSGAPRDSNHRPQLHSSNSYPVGGAATGMPLPAGAGGGLPAPSWDDTPPLPATGQHSSSSAFDNHGSSSSSSNHHDTSSSGPTGFSYSSSADAYHRQQQQQQQQQGGGGPSSAPYPSQMASMSRFYAPPSASNSSQSLYASQGTSFANAPTATTMGSGGPAAFSPHSSTYQQSGAHHFATSSTTGGHVLDQSMLPSPTLQQQHHHYGYGPSSSSHHHPHSAPLSDYSDVRSQYMNPFEVKHRRRTTRSQFKVLETTFKDNPKPNATTRKNLSQQLDMPLRAVQIWFQNRRAKAKAVAKKGGGGGDRGGSSGQDQDGKDRSFQDIDERGEPIISGLASATSSGYDFDEDDLRYSSSSSSSLRPQTAGADLGFHPSSTTSSYALDTFKVPNRPMKVEGDLIGRRPTTASSSTFPSANHTTSTFYHSPPSSAGGLYSSHPSNASSYDSYPRPTSSSMSSNSTSLDDHYRRSGIPSPLLQHESPHTPFPLVNSHRQGPVTPGLEMQLPAAYDPDPRRQQEGLPSSSTIDSSTLRGPGQSEESNQSNYWRY